LAEIALQSCRVVDVINELWPLVGRLEARAADVSWIGTLSFSSGGRARP
jgi:hypothetical protein